MASDWQLMTAEQFCNSVRDGTHDSPKPVDEGRFLVTSRHITGGRVDLANAYLITQADFDAINKRSKVDQWDVLFSMIGTVGELCLIKDEPNFAIKNIGLFKSKGETEGKWLYYYLRNSESQQLIREQSRGTTQQYIPLGALREFPVLVPSNRDEMCAITHILGTLDDKIELNRRMNETLEAMARALFKSWFVDFDPVRAKAEGRDPGLPKPLADLFPDSFVDSELGEIPKGWRIGVIRDLAYQIQYGFTQSASIDPVGPKFLRITDIQGGKIDWGTVPFCKATPEEHERYRLKAGDILVARTGASTGENIFLPSAPNAVFASYLVRFQFKDLSYARLIGAFMRTPAYFEYVAGGIGGSAQPNASAQVLGGARLVIPPQSLAHKFADFVIPLDLQSSANADESRTLATLRDTLLPKLISGEFRINSIERSAEEVCGSHTTTGK